MKNMGSHHSIDFVAAWEKLFSSLVYDKEEALARFKQASLLDSRISAYPAYTGFGGINRQAPNFIFIDLVMAICLGEVDTEMQQSVDLDYYKKNKNNMLQPIPVAEKITEMIFKEHQYHNGQSVEIG
ncbi:MAG TPA: hypothetical protein VN922_03080 [Bacteroidia bacterium]|jgi:hypothetical protein|nr:hypothetical protein [Bacteroidia bacterium]